MIQSKVNASSTDERIPERMVFAGLVGIILTFGLLVGALLATALFANSAQCGHWGCFGFIGYVWEIGRWVAIVLAWPLLYLLRVRPAWPVAILAAFFLVAIWQFADGSFIVLSGVIAYPLAALVTAPRLSWPWRVIPVALFLALYLFASLFPG
ncbi:hypothetical protein [Streptosporangium sp. NPDC087985]|uniref:hypothetical protein n=1 Tax=Streptosporangium sp. NPDC087985 TaxID=3366196 RepID=UPI00381F3BD4